MSQLIVATPYLSRAPSSFLLVKFLVHNVLWNCAVPNANKTSQETSTAKFHKKEQFHIRLQRIWKTQNIFEKMMYVHGQHIYHYECVGRFIRDADLLISNEFLLHTSLRCCGVSTQKFLAECCSFNVLQCVAVCRSVFLLHTFLRCCSVSQIFAECCSCNVLQCVAMCCSALHTSFRSSGLGRGGRFGAPVD